MTERVKGMTVAEAKNFKWAEIVDDLGGLPQQKIHCSVMAVEGLKKAIADYEKNQTIKPAGAKASLAKVKQAKIKAYFAKSKTIKAKSKRSNKFKSK
ncbi:MAG: iron-sulfur cluster assembly scaffold protein [Candidatus Falkowbacteria bacterium]|nr:iron-sulfur cluster assembly scaffold protein [Candidatus Falkowbacteria bacterium]